MMRPQFGCGSDLIVQRIDKNDMLFGHANGCRSGVRNAVSSRPPGSGCATKPLSGEALVCGYAASWPRSTGPSDPRAFPRPRSRGRDGPAILQSADPRAGVAWGVRTDCVSAVTLTPSISVRGITRPTVSAGRMSATVAASFEQAVSTRRNRPLNVVTTTRCMASPRLRAQDSRLRTREKQRNLNDYRYLDGQLACR